MNLMGVAEEGDKHLKVFWQCASALAASRLAPQLLSCGRRIAVNMGGERNRCPQTAATGCVSYHCR
jgi:hypothetical protein